MLSNQSLYLSNKELQSGSSICWAKFDVRTSSDPHRVVLCPWVVVSPKVKPTKINAF